MDGPPESGGERGSRLNGNDADGFRWMHGFDVVDIHAKAVSR